MSTMKKARVFRSKRSLAFYIGILVLPVTQFLIFYIVVNANSFLLAFRKIDPLNFKKIEFTFENFKVWFTDKNENAKLVEAIKVSLKSYLITVCVSVPLGLFFSYYIAKKMRGAMFFRLMLFLPSIISSIVLVTVYRYFTSYVVPDILKIFGITPAHTNFVDYKTTRYGFLMFYNLFVGFGTNVLLYSNKMATISPEIEEAAELDGVNSFQEFIYIVLPQVFSTMSIFLVSGIAAIFTNELNNFSFYNYKLNTNTTTVGFLMFNRVRDAGARENLYPPLAALGLMITFVVIPLTFIVKRLLKRFGPSED